MGWRENFDALVELVAREIAEDRFGDAQCWRKVKDEARDHCIKVRAYNNALNELERRDQAYHTRIMNNMLRDEYR